MMRDFLQRHHHHHHRPMNHGAEFHCLGTVETISRTQLMSGSGNRGGFTKVGLFDFNDGCGRGCCCGCMGTSMNNMIR